MLPSCSTSAVRVLTATLLLLNITYAIALPNQVPHQQYAHGVLNARAASSDTEDAHDIAVTLNDKKDAKNFLKDLGAFLSDFDPVEVFRNILGGILGLKADTDANATISAEASPTTTVIILPTPIEVNNSISVTASLTAEASLGIAAFSSSGPKQTVIRTLKTTVTKKVTATPIRSSVSKKLSASVALVISTPSANGEVSSALPSFPPFEPVPETFNPPTPTLIGILEISAALSVEEPSPVVETIASTESEQRFSILPFFGPGEHLSDNVTWPTSIPIEAPEIPTMIETTATTEPEERFSILPFFEPGEHLSDNVTSPTSTLVEIAEDIPTVVEATATEEPEQRFSILPFFEPGEHLSDNVTWPTPTSIEILEALEVSETPTVIESITTSESEEIFSILPFFEPGEHLSDNVTWPVPTNVEPPIPDLPIPMFTDPAETFAALGLQDDAISTPISSEVDIPLQTGDTGLVPLLEFVNGTYVSPTTKPHFVTPVLLPPKPTRPHNIVTGLALPSIRPHRSIRPAKNSTKTRTHRYTKPILLPPPLVRPTFKPLPEPLFNLTAGLNVPIVKPTRPLILTNPLRPTSGIFGTFNASEVLKNITVGTIIPIVKPTRPLILTNPLRPTGGVFGTFNASEVVKNITLGTIIPVVKPTRPLVLTNPLRPTIEVFGTFNVTFNASEVVKNLTTGTIVPVVKPTRPLILTNPLRPTFDPLVLFDASDILKTSTKTVKSKATSYVTFVVVPTPVTEVPDVSILGVDVPADEPLPSSLHLALPGLPVHASQVSPVSIPAPTVLNVGVVVPGASIIKANISIKAPSPVASVVTPSLAILDFLKEPPTLKASVSP
ncbi:hypothetical protein N0V90_009308 [Kalmusia sp. IMI 367209]|nr:hypothetical protein N0V90_009308 [Kalmusia sp. IMI 367209]